MVRITESARAARRDQILGGALVCFARGGYHATTMSDVAAEVGVSKGTPYLYFPSKEGLFLALYEEWDCGLANRIAAAVDGLDPAAANSPRQVLRAVVLAVGAHVEAHAQACRVLMEASLMAADQPDLATAVRAGQGRTDESLSQLIESGVAAGEWPADTDPTLQAKLISATLYGLMARWHLAPHSMSWNEIADAIAATGPVRDRLRPLREHAAVLPRRHRQDSAAPPRGRANHTPDPAREGRTA